MANLRVEMSGYWEVETTIGTEIVPFFVVPETATLEDLQEHLEGKVLDDLDPQTEDRGFVWRLEDPGFMTENLWSASPTYRQAIEDAFMVYGDDLNFDIVFYEVLEPFAAALVTGDDEYLDDDEIDTLEQFALRVEEQFGPGHWDMMSEDGGDFDECEISGVWGNVVTVAYVTKNDKSSKG